MKQIVVLMQNPRVAVSGNASVEPDRPKTPKPAKIDSVTYGRSR